VSVRWGNPTPLVAVVSGDNPPPPPSRYSLDLPPVPDPEWVAFGYIEPQDTPAIRVTVSRYHCDHDHHRPRSAFYDDDGPPRTCPLCGVTMGGPRLPDQERVEVRGL
jgi:hypothetical protein